MAIAQIDQFTQALTGTMVQVIVVCAILVAVVGLPLYWFRLKVEQALICAIRSARARRQTGKSPRVPMNLSLLRTVRIVVR